MGTDHSASHEIAAALAAIGCVPAGWHYWRGVSGILYARRPKSSPPIVVRGADPAALAGEIRKWHQAHPQ